jgi:holo-[acyl-carrier protein] synthase
MIIGVGTDIIEIKRIEELLASAGEKFIERVFNPEERGEGAAHYAKRFAAKEAISKAMGTGIGASLSFKDIVIGRAESGQPLAKIRGRDDLKIHLSFSDEKLYAVAFAVVEKI